MSYCYEVEKAALMTHEGMRLVLEVKDEATRLIALAGACTADRALNTVSGSSWTQLAALDYLVETGYLRRVLPREQTRGQDQVFVAGRS